MGDLSRRKKIFQVVKNTKIFQSGFIVMSDLPRWKMKDFQSSFIIMGDLPRWKNTKIFQKWSHYNGRPTQVKNDVIFQK
jgi:hypothetical protein